MFLLLSYNQKGYSQISPGDLSSAHKDLDGMSNCTKCHVLGDKISNSKCLDCHKEIETLIIQNRGYHSSSMVKSGDCWDCHSEHFGRNFSLINFNTKSFNHNLTTFKLTGAHANAECKACHKPEFITVQKLKSDKDTFLGLSNDCNSCHEDFHQGTLGKECQDCHNSEKFRPARKFDHNNTLYKLTGAHQTVECTKCHPVIQKEGKDFQKFKGIAFSNCNSCHKDVHNGKFGNDCSSCHQTASFRKINEKAFDHSKTNFPLIGKHRLTTCSDCHKQGLGDKPKFAECTDCHSDFHKGQFTVNGKPRNCSECHNEFGFLPSKFTIEKHNRLEFPLSGSHLAVPCVSCHFKEENWDFTGLGERCIDCHENPHGSELTEKFMPASDCSYCHDSSAWATIKFDHNLTKFRLEGRHLDVSCGSCHRSGESLDEFQYKFVNLGTECTVCHKDPHYSQFLKGSTSDCLRCHTFENWKAGRFDHNKTNFSLEGAHQKLECSQCHKRVEVNGNSFIQYRLESFKCASCHK